MTHKKFYHKKCRLCLRLFTIEHDDYDSTHHCPKCEDSSLPPVGKSLTGEVLSKIIYKNQHERRNSMTVFTDWDSAAKEIIAMFKK